MLLNYFKNFNKIKFTDFFYIYLQTNLCTNISSHIGYVHTATLNFLLTKYDEYFFVDEKNNKVFIVYNDNSYNALSTLFNNIAIFFKNNNLINSITNEYFNVDSINESKKGLFKIDRSLLQLFGIKAKGVHLNGYVIKNQQLYLWIAKRSKSKSTYPGKLDNIVAGAISYGYNANNTLKKEAYEEANINTKLLNAAKLVNIISYLYPYYNGIRNDTAYIYNAELPLCFNPKSNDNEVDSFILMKAEEVLNILQQKDYEFKFNSAISVIIFLLSKNIISSNNVGEASYKRIKEEIANLLCLVR